MAQTMRTAFSCLEALSLAPSGLTVAEVARVTSIGRMAVSRILDSLSEASVVTRDTQTKRYRLRLRLYELSTNFIQVSLPLNLARKEIIRLSSETYRQFNFLVPDGTDMMNVESAEWFDGQVISRPVASRRPWHVSISGKAIAAFSSPALQAKLFESVAATSNDLAILRDELDKIRAQGYAELRSELREDMYGAAVPIYDYSGFAVAAIATFLNEADLEPSNEVPLLAQMLKSAGRISEDLGFRNQHQEGIL